MWDPVISKLLFFLTKRLQLRFKKTQPQPQSQTGAKADQVSQ
jgi:hypothetical protein